MSDAAILKFLDDCHTAGIKNPHAFLISKMPQVFGYLKGCFPRGILPTDVDGEVELCGQFLRFEFKNESLLRNGLIPRGQAMAFRSLISTRRFTVMLIGTNNRGEETCADVWYPNGEKEGLQDINRAWVQAKCAEWSWFAERSAKEAA